MARKIYDPDIIDRHSATERDAIKARKENKNSGKGDPTTSDESSAFRIIVDFFKNRRTHTFIGILLSLFGVYLLIIFISYLSNGAADQSFVMSSRPLAEGVNVGNAGAAAGAVMAEAFISRGVGLAAFIVVAWCLIIGIRMTLPSTKVHFFHYTLMSLVNIIMCVMVLGAISLYANPVFFPLGGNVGYYSNQLLQTFTGTPGMILIDILIVVLWALICYKTLQLIYSTVKKYVPKRTKLRDDDECTDDEITEIVKTGDDKKQYENVDDVDEENPFEPEVVNNAQDEGTEKIDSLNEQRTDEKNSGDADVKSSGVSEIESTITVSKPIEQGSENRFEAYDPTKELSKYKMPPLDLLRDGNSKQQTADIEEQEANKQRITETLAHYDIQIKKIDVCVGPTISLFEIQPCDGVRISKIKGLGNDIQMSLAALGIRIIAPIPGKCTIGIEVPNKDPQTVYMRSILGSAKFQNAKMELPMALGCTITNDVAVADLAKMPHLLVAGATGQGKSVGLNAIIASLLYKKHPSELKLVLIDPKMVEFSLYSKLEYHYLAKLTGEDECIVIDSKKAIATLNSLVQEMENRNHLLRDAGERNIKDYNAKFIARKLNPEKGHRYMPYIVLVVDEYADLVMSGGKDVERPIARIAQKARAVGIHMIIATQRPSTDVITGMIKANFPGRIAFKVVQMVDSRTILDCPGAEQLVGRGDMLFSSAGSVVERIQCAFIDTPEVESICEYIGSQVGYEEAYELPEYIPEPDEKTSDREGGSMSLSDRDPLFDEIAQYIVTSDTASTSSLQRHYNIGYNRAGRIMDQMEAAGIVGPSQGGKPRKVLIDSTQLQGLLAQ